MVGNADPTTGRIASTGRLDRTGYQIRNDGICDIGLKYDGRRVSWRWGYWHGKYYVGIQSIKKETAIRKAITIKGAIKIVIGDQVYDRNRDRDRWSGI